MKKKLVSMFLVVCMMLSLMAGCGSKETQTGGGSTGSTSGTSGSSESSTIKVGAIFALEGANALAGANCKLGVELAVEELNAAGGINGQQVEVIFMDDKGDAVEALNCYNKLSSECVAILGSNTSKSTLGFVSAAGEEGMPVVVTSSSNKAVTLAGDSIFRAIFNDPYVGKQVSEYMVNDLGYETVATLYNASDDYSAGLEQIIYETNPDTIVIREAYNTGDTDFKTQLTKIRDAGVDALCIPNLYNDCALMVKQANELGLTCDIISVTGFNGALETLEDPTIANGVIFCGHFAPDSPKQSVVDFVAKWAEKNPDVYCDQFCALGYDSANILFDALSRAASFSREDIVAALAETDMDVVTGHIKYDENGDPSKECFWQIAVNGEYKSFDLEAWKKDKEYYNK